MNKKIIAYLMAISILTVTGCGSSNTQNDLSGQSGIETNVQNTTIDTDEESQTDVNETELLEISKTLVNDMMSGNFKTIVDKFDDKLKAQLNEESMESAWDSVLLPLGDYTELNSEKVQTIGEYMVVELVYEYENDGLKVTISYDKEGKVGGINLNYVPVQKDAIDNDKLEEINVTVGSELPLDGILTLPKAVDNPPVVLLVHGSGPNDKNSTIFGNKPFEDIAHGLAERGIATLRYDKRYNAYPDSVEGDGSKVTLEDEVLQDVDMAIDLLLKENRVDKSNLYVLGHSLGGGLTPYIASENQEVKGIISLAGTLRPLYEVIYDQNKEVEKNILEGDFDEDTVNQFKTQMEQVEKDILTLRGDISSIDDKEVLMGMHVGYQKSVKQYTGENFIDDINIPVLVLQGSADFQVSPDTDYKTWEEALAGRDNATLKLYDGLNHLMMTTNGKRDITEYQTKGNVSDEVIDDIAEFITNNTK